MRAIIKRGGSAVTVIGTIKSVIEIYQFVEKHWPQLKLAAVIIKKTIEKVSFSRKASIIRRGTKPQASASSGKIVTQRITVITGDPRRDSKVIIRFGHVGEDNAKLFLKDFRSWFSKLPERVKQEIERQAAAGRFQE